MNAQTHRFYLQLFTSLHKCMFPCLKLTCLTFLPSVCLVIRPHTKSEKKHQEYSSVDSVNNSTGSKTKLSSVSATSLSAEEEAFEQVYQQRFRSPLKTFMNEKILRRQQCPQLWDSLDSSASCNKNGTSSWDSDSGNPCSGSIEHSLNQDDKSSCRSRVSLSDDVFEPDTKHVRSNTSRLPPTPEGKKARKYRAYSTPNTQQVAESSGEHKKAVASTLTASDHESDAQSDARTAITPDILAEIEQARRIVSHLFVNQVNTHFTFLQAFQRAAKGFQSRSKMQ